MKKLLLSVLLVSLTCYSQTFEGYPTATPSVFNPASFIKFNNKLFYFARNANFETGLYSTDGTTSGNQLVFSLGFVNYPPLGRESYTEKKIIYNNQLYFLLDDKLYKTDGTSAGTVLVKQGINLGRWLFVYNSNLYFTGFSSGAGIELWKSDGTTAGTAIFKDINPGTGNAFSNTNTTGFDPHFTLFNNKMFFVANDGTTGYELWSTDGAAAGTSLFKDIRPPAEENNVPTNPDGFGAFWGGFGVDSYCKTPFKVANGKMYFPANRRITIGMASFNDSWILYETDGTATATNYYVNPAGGNLSLVQTPINANNFMGLTEYNNDLYITNGNIIAENLALGLGLFKISSNNTFSKVANFSFSNIGARGNSVDAQLGEMYLLNDEFYFLGRNPAATNNNFFLYKLNPATETFTQITTTSSGSLSDFVLYLSAKVVNNQLYFYKDQPDQIFVTNGTTAGTLQLARAAQNGTSIQSDQNITTDVLGMSDFNNSLYFNAGIAFGQNSLYRIFNSPLGMEENEKITFKIYPNPTINTLNLQFEENLDNGSLSIVSISGQTVLEKQNLSGTDFNFDVSHLNSGIYIMQISDKTSVYNSKFIKK